MKLFLRACKNFIPLRANLYSRGMSDDPSCPVCGFEKETKLHALIACLAVLTLWFVSPFEFRCDRLNSSMFVDWLLFK